MVFAVHNFLFYYSIVKKRVCFYLFSFPGASGISVVIVPTHIISIMNTQTDIKIQNTGATSNRTEKQ